MGEYSTLMLVLGVAVCVIISHYHHVIELSPLNFDVEVRGAGFVLVEFYLDHHNPALDDAARLLKDFSVAAIDAKTHTEIANKYGVTAYPTYKLFRDGIDMTYTGVHTAPELIYFCLDQLDRYLDGRSGGKQSIFPSEHSDSALIHLRSRAEFDALLEIEQTAVIAFFTNERDPGLNMYVSVAENNLEGFAFSVVHAQSLMDKLNVKHEGEVHVYHEGQLHAKTVIGIHHTQLDSLAMWVSDTCFRELRKVSAGALERLIFDGLPSLLIVLESVPNSPADVIDLGIPYLPTFELRELAKQYRSSVTFLFAERIEVLDLVQSLGINENDLPALVLFDPQTEHKFVFGHHSDMVAMSDVLAQLNSHVSQFVDGSLEPTLKSAPIPSATDGPVVTVVGKTFWNVVNSEKNVLLLFYAPWCQHSKAFLPIFRQIGERLSGANQYITTAMFDVDANDIPRNVTVNVVPTLLLFTPTQPPFTFKGNRTEDDVIRFVSTYAKDAQLIAGLDPRAQKIKENIKSAQPDHAVLPSE